MSRAKINPRSPDQVAAAEKSVLALPSKKRKVGGGSSTASLVPTHERPVTESDDDDAESGRAGGLLLGLDESLDSWSSIGVAPWLVTQCLSMGLQVLTRAPGFASARTLHHNLIMAVFLFKLHPTDNLSLYSGPLPSKSPVFLLLWLGVKC